MNADLPDIDALIPHRPPMRLIDRVIEIEGDTITALASVPANGPFVSAGADPPGYVVVEMMAQTVGAWDGWQRRQRGDGPEVGFLLGTRRLRCDRPTLVPGTTVRIEARMLFSDGELASFACTAREGGAEPFAEATLNVFCPATGRASKVLP
jgi:predicted hotdog family 3-hydroxylacyl-ACP dehydratase